MKKNIYILFFGMTLLQSPIASMAGHNPDMSKGDYLYNHKAFGEAILSYEKVVKKYPRKKDIMLFTRMADCYRLIKDPANAATWYDKAVSINVRKGRNDDIKLHYAEVLMALERYDDAAAMLNQYLVQKPKDRRAANMLTGCTQSKIPAGTFPDGVTSLLSINTDGSDFSPAIYGNKLAFTTDSVISGSGKKDKWTGHTYYNLCSVSCNTAGVCGTDLEPLGGKVNSKYHDATCIFTRDGSKMYFTRTAIEEDLFGQSAVADNEGTVRLQIMIADGYDPETKKYKKIHPFPYNGKNYSTAQPAISPDENMLVFASDMQGGEGGIDLYACRKENNGEWGKPVSLGKTINTEGEEMFPVFTDNKTLAFASNGHPGYGGLDVFYTTWNDNGQQWSTPVNAGRPVNSPYDDMSLTMYDDHLNGYFASNRPAMKKGDNIYHLFKEKIFLGLTIIDSVSGRSLSDVAISMQSAEDTRSFSSDADGRLTTQLYPMAGYNITLKKQGFNPYTMHVSAAGNNVTDTLLRTVKMLPEDNIPYAASILDEATRTPIENPMLVITREGSNITDTINLQTGVPLHIELKAGNVYHINAVKENYYSDEKTVSTKNRPEGFSITGFSDTILMCKLTIGAICQIENIYYDFNKATIRSDAKPSLDKLLKLLRQYPAMKVQLNSHTDCRGADEYNMKLSVERANVVIRYMSSKGINANRLKAKGFGSANPVNRCEDCENCPEEKRRQNRRTEFQVLTLTGE
ncbi:OmpA family protein [Chitinophagaceae bacterium MMS25-I14]